MLGIIISIIATAIISVLIANWQMKKNKIVHFTINSYDIGKGLSDEFPEFKLQFDGETLSKNVSVLKGGFMNTGRNDIEKPEFTLNLPKGCVVKTIKVTPLTNNLKVKATINQEKTNSIQFVIEGIFISDEYFEYTAIVEVPKEIGNLVDKLTFQHRIKNTEKINNAYVGQYQRVAKRKKHVNIVTFCYTLLFIPLILLLCLYPKMQFKVVQKDTNKEVEIHVNSQSKLIVCKPNTILFPLGKSITPEEFENNYRVDTITAFKLSSDSISIVVMFGLSILLFVTLLLIEHMKGNGHIIKVLNKK